VLAGTLPAHWHPPMGTSNHAHLTRWSAVAGQGLVGAGQALAPRALAATIVLPTPTWKMMLTQY
jgi:hypothetical protein